MQYRTLGNTGIKISEISLGSWLTYGLGSLAEDLPSFVVMTSSDREKTCECERTAEPSMSQALHIANGDTVYVERMPMVYIYGEVQRPGAMRLERDMTVLQGLASGGGLTQRGTEKGIRVHRKGADGRVQIITPGMDDRMQDGDVVYVRESLF